MSGYHFVSAEPKVKSFPINYFCSNCMTVFLQMTAFVIYLWMLYDVCTKFRFSEESDAACSGRAIVSYKIINRFNCHQYSVNYYYE
jgi:hypothetical protein